MCRVVPKLVHSTVAQEGSASLGCLTPWAPRREADMAKRAALEKQRAAQGLGPEGQAAERRLQATAAEIEANKRCVIA